MTKLLDAAKRVLELRNTGGSLGDEIQAYTGLAEAVDDAEKPRAPRRPKPKPAAKKSSRTKKRA